PDVAIESRSGAWINDGEVVNKCAGPSVQDVAGRIAHIQSPTRVHRGFPATAGAAGRIRIFPEEPLVRAVESENIGTAIRHVDIALVYGRSAVVTVYD